MRTFYSLCFFIVCSLSVSAQDIHFSQFYMSPLNLNPAMTGVMNCNSRVAINYRSQWASILGSSAFQTYSVSYDQRIAVGRDDNFGIGATFWGDRAGQADFATTTGKLSASYAKKVGGSRKYGNYLVAGVEGGAAQRSLNFLKLRWGTQHDGAGGFDPAAPTLETGFDRDQFLFMDLAAGLLWFMVFDENNSLYAGGSFHHLNRADQSFSSAEEDLLYSRYTVHAGGEFMLGRRIGLVPGVIMMSQGPSFQVNAGTNVKFLLDGGRNTNTQSFQVGLWTRVSNRLDDSVLTDAIILSSRFDYENFALGFSYDINTSGLSDVTNGNGGFELSLQYKICGKQQRGVYCPTF
ncbi:PorP/SprF family type IX secretion system membrane protein [Neolewinella antarctica]|uniref:Type IX secretion system PorP/SprF family membrane protein n=1 Tax=Neolewinella antarctica TaxID=442734 RepID=A0ABX0X9H5_9BACT|nr:PorP/SprF family type IX secretion system membrane protein [Neolewinella antarctica]NJC25921.1 type IX secretion system PorP/SprF family membrane protein [Neolewinella antarctica]